MIPTPAQSTENSADIVYVGGFSFPDRDAGGTRVLMIGRALRSAGFRVAFAGIERGGLPEERLAGGRFAFDGFPYLPTGEQEAGGLARWRRCWRTHLTGNSAMDRLRAFDSGGVRAIIAYNAPSFLLWRLLSYCRGRRVVLIADCTEWYDASHLNGGPLGPFRWDTDFRMRCLQPRIGRIIAISSYLASYYQKLGCAVIRVPPLVDMSELAPDDPHDRQHDGVLRLVYAGSPGKKDLLGNALRALHAIRTEQPPVKLDVVGPSREGVEACLGGDAAILNELGSMVVCHGRMARRDALRLVQLSDFSILLRPDARSAHAGFPTKLAESMSLGVPIMSNVTSDIAEYIRDGREGVLLGGSTCEAFTNGVRRVLAMGRPTWAKMRSHAKRRAAECFDYRNYIEPLGRFLREVMDCPCREEGML